MCTRATWRGVTVCAHMVPDLDALASNVGTDITLRPFLNPPSGSYQTTTSASAGTHAGGGAIDFDMSAYSDTQARHVETVCRDGLKLAYFRAPISGLWQKHVHVTFPACASLSTAARNQYPIFQQGLDNLADNGPDTGDRSHVAQIMSVFRNPSSATPVINTGGLTMADLNTVVGKLDTLTSKVDALATALTNFVGQEGARYSSNYDTDKGRYSALQGGLDALKAELDALKTEVDALPKA